MRAIRTLKSRYIVICISTNVYFFDIVQEKLWFFLKKNVNLATFLFFCFWFLTRYPKPRAFV